MIYIQKIEKKKRESHVYTISLSNGETYDIWDEMMVKYKFSLESTIQQEQLDQASDETQYYRGKDSALKFLRNKSRALAEIELFLKNKGYFDDSIHRIKEFLIENNLVNDEALAQEYILEAIPKGYGSLKIKHDLQKKGITESIIEEKIHRHFSKDLEYKMAYTTFQDKLKGEIINKKNCIKAARFLATRGYAPEIIDEIIYKFIE